MGLSGDTKDLLQSALGTPEAKNEVANAIDSSLKNDGSVPLAADLDAGGHKITNVGEPTEDSDVATKAYVDDSPSGTGDIKSDGSVPFAADQSMGGNKLTNVEDPTSAQDASTKAYVDAISLLNNATTLYVDPVSGNDSTGTGNINKPFQTLEAAQASFSDESNINPYTLVLLGYSAEAPTYIPKQFVNIVGLDPRISGFYHNDDSPIEMTYDGGDTFDQIFSNLTIDADFFITRNYVGITPITGNNIAARFWFDHANVAGLLELTGSGNLSTAPDYDVFNFDNVFMIDCDMANINLNMVGLRMDGCDANIITFSDIGIDMPYDPAQQNFSGNYVNNINNSFINRLTHIGASGSQVRNTKVTRINVNGNIADPALNNGPSYNADGMGFPAGGAANNSVVLTTTNQLTQYTFSQSGTFYDVSGAAKSIQAFNTGTGVYFWFNVTDGANTQSDPGGTGTGVQVDILSADTSVEIATKFNTALNDSGSFDSTNDNPSIVVAFGVNAGSTTTASTPDSAADILLLRKGATADMSQINRTTISNRLREPVKTVTSATNTLNAFVDRYVYTNKSTSGSVTLTLPTIINNDGFAEGIPYFIIDQKGDASSNPVTINCGSGDTFPGGATSITINENYGYRILTYHNGVWSIIGTSNTLPLTGGTITPLITQTGLTIDATINNGATALVVKGAPGENVLETYQDDTNSAWFVTANGVLANQGNQAGAIALDMGGKGITANGGIDVSSSFSSTAALNMNSNLINSVTDPVSAQDAATKNYVDNKILVFTSSAGAGGTPTEALTVTGILATDTILSVSQMTPGANSLPLLGYSTLGNNTLTGIWSADPGAGSVIVVSVKR